MSKDKKYKPPKSTKGDTAHAVARAGLSAIPVAGGAASELFSMLITPPLERRRREWMEEVGKGLGRLEQELGVKLEDLRENPAFIDTAMHASQAAMRNSQREKREALRNAVLHSALPQAPEQALQILFLDLVDAFTEWHLRMLKLFQDPVAWFERNHTRGPNVGMGALAHILTAAFPELGDRRWFYDQLWRDLYTRGLVNTDSLHVMMSGHGLVQPRTTDPGDQFLAFITAPLPESKVAG